MTSTATRRNAACLLCVYVAFAALNEARLFRREFVDNVQVDEAKAWWAGRLNLPERQHDTALKDGKAYCHFPPLFTIIAAGFVPVFGGVPHAVIVALVLLLIWAAYALMRRRTASCGWAIVLAVGLIGGTSLWPVLDKTVRGASPYYVNHVLATLGLLVFLAEYFGRRRVWAAGAGVIIAALSRQLAIAYALPLLWMAWRGAAGEAPVPEITGKMPVAQITGKMPVARVHRLAVAGGCIALVMLITMGLNAAKFGDPLDSGYMRIYEGRDDALARVARQHGLFSPWFVPRNLYHANLGFPRVQTITMAGERETHVRPNTQGTGIWWTTPLLLLLPFCLRAIWRSPDERVLLIAAAMVFAALMMFHNTGAEQRGYNRFSLDYLPVLLALAIPGCTVGWRRWATAACVGWSVVYFRFLI